MLPKIIKNVLRQIFQPWKDFSSESKGELILLLKRGHVNVLTLNEYVPCMGAHSRVENCPCVHLAVPRLLVAASG